MAVDFHYPSYSCTNPRHRLPCHERDLGDWLRTRLFVGAPFEHLTSAPVIVEVLARREARPTRRVSLRDARASGGQRAPCLFARAPAQPGANAPRVCLRASPAQAGANAPVSVCAQAPAQAGANAPVSVCAQAPAQAGANAPRVRLRKPPRRRGPTCPCLFARKPPRRRGPTRPCLFARKPPRKRGPTRPAGARVNQCCAGRWRYRPS